jgi:hypothetical protein
MVGFRAKARTVKLLPSEPCLAEGSPPQRTLERWKKSFQHSAKLPMHKAPPPPRAKLPEEYKHVVGGFMLWCSQHRIIVDQARIIDSFL